MWRTSSRLEAERANLLDRRLRLARLRAEQRVEDQPELARVAHVVEPEAGVDQHQPFGALDEQAVADQLARAEQAAFAVDQPLAVRAHRAAAEVVERARGGVHAGKPTCAPCDRARDAELGQARVERADALGVLVEVLLPDDLPQRVRATQHVRLR